MKLKARFINTAINVRITRRLNFCAYLASKEAYLLSRNPAKTSSKPARLISLCNTARMVSLSGKSRAVYHFSIGVGAIYYAKTSSYPMSRPVDFGFTRPHVFRVDCPNSDVGDIRQARSHIYGEMARLCHDWTH